MLKRCSVVCVLVMSVVCQGAVRLEFIDRGEPTDGVTTLHGWRGVVIRAVSDGGPITRVDAGPAARLGGIDGAQLLQRWIDPTGNGLYAVSDPRFSQRSPLGLADNATPTVENFDSHLLGDPAHMQVIWPFGEKNYDVQHFYLRTSLTSDGFVGYGASWPEPTFDPEVSIGLGQIWGVYDVPPPYQMRTMDLAYVVSDSLVGYSFTVTADGIPWSVGGVRFAPEPTELCVILSIVGTLFRSRRKPFRNIPSVAAVEKIEPRLMYSLSTLGTTPLAIQASPMMSGGVQIQWDTSLGTPSLGRYGIDNLS